MNNSKWKEEADLYKELLETSNSEIHFGVGIPGNNLLGLIQPAANTEVALDVGCGSGENVLALAKLGYKVVGVDSSDRQINLAKDLSNKTDFKSQTDFRVIAAEQLSNLTEEFDLVISVGVLHFCADLKSVIREIAMKLKTKGKIVLSLPHPIDMICDYHEMPNDVEIILGSYFPSGHMIQGARYWSKFGGHVPLGYNFSEYIYPISSVIQFLLSEGLRLEAFLEPICDHKDTYPCKFKLPSDHFIDFYSARVPQYAIYVASKI